jgi:outer membrane protein TolC
MARRQSWLARAQLQQTHLSVVAAVVNDCYRLAVLSAQQTIWQTTLDTADELDEATQKACRAGQSLVLI